MDHYSNLFGQFFAPLPFDVFADITFDQFDDSRQLVARRDQGIGFFHRRGDFTEAAESGNGKGYTVTATLHWVIEPDENPVW